MKRELALAVVMLFGIAAAPAQEATPAQKANVIYQQAVTALNAGEVAKAKGLFEEVLKIQPNHPHAIYQLRTLKADAPELEKKHRETQFGKIMIPQVDFQNCTLSEALTALAGMVAKAAGEDARPNFVIQDPTSKLSEKPVSLKLKNIPAKAVLTYLLEQTGGSARFDEHAIVIIGK